MLCYWWWHSVYRCSDHTHALPGELVELLCVHLPCSALQHKMFESVTTLKSAPANVSSVSVELQPSSQHSHSAIVHSWSRVVSHTQWLVNKDPYTHTRALSYTLNWDTHPIRFGSAISVRSLFPSLSSSLHIFFLSLSAQKTVVPRGWLIITEYTKLGEGKKKKQFLCRLMSDMRETKITKRGLYKEERKLAHSFSNSLLLLFFADLLSCLCLLSF